MLHYGYYNHVAVIKKRQFGVVLLSNLVYQTAIFCVLDIETNQVITKQRTKE
jgi:hypothetical protein